YHGSQCIVVAIDARRVSAAGEPARWEVFTHGGRKPTGLDAVAWARRMAAYGAGEILLTSMDRDGTKSGFDLELTRAVSDAVPVPVIASGGVGSLQHLADGVTTGRASAVLAASIFHFGQHTVRECNQFMADQGIAVRLGSTRSHEYRTRRDGRRRLRRQRPDSRHRPGRRKRPDPHGGLDEPRRARRNRRHRARGLLVALAPAPVAQGRGIRAYAGRARIAPGLRRRRGPAQGPPARRHRLPYRPRELLLPPPGRCLRRGFLGHRRPRPERPGTHLQMTAPAAGADTLARIADTLATRRPDQGGDPQTSYVAKLLAKGPDAFLKKIGEEATELVMAAKDGAPDRIISETAD